MNKIKCQVKKCHYNEDDSCVSKHVEVCNCNCDEANHKDQTSCSTFKVKETK